jgi:hypothetical protein
MSRLIQASDTPDARFRKYITAESVALTRHEHARLWNADMARESAESYNISNMYRRQSSRIRAEHVARRERAVYHYRLMVRHNACAAELRALQCSAPRLFRGVQA